MEHKPQTSCKNTSSASFFFFFSYTYHERSGPPTAGVGSEDRVAFVVNSSGNRAFQ